MQEDLITGVRFLGATQFIVLSIVLALVYRGRVQSKVYNRSRMLIIIGSMILGIQLLVQFLGHFRETNLCLCWLINLLCYLLVVPAYNLSELNLLRSGNRMKRPTIAAVAYITIGYILMIVGLLTDTLIDNEKPWMTTTCAIAVVFSLMVFQMSWRLHHEMRVADNRLSDVELEERHTALRYTALSIRLLLVVTLVSPWIGIFSCLLPHIIYGIIIYAIISWYMVSFFMYGYKMEEVILVENELFEAEIQNGVLTDETVKNREGLTTESTIAINEIAPRVDAWVASHHFTDPNLKLDEALSQMNIPLAMLNFYLDNVKHVQGYRQWISMLRVNYAKQLMTENPNYTLDAIAEMCGFSGRQSLSRAFKSHFGVAPNLWADVKK